MPINFQPYIPQAPDLLSPAMNMQKLQLLRENQAMDRQKMEADRAQKTIDNFVNLSRISPGAKGAGIAFARGNKDFKDITGIDVDKLPPDKQEEFQEESLMVLDNIEQMKKGKVDPQYLSDYQKSKKQYFAAKYGGDEASLKQIEAVFPEKKTTGEIKSVVGSEGKPIYKRITGEEEVPYAPAETPKEFAPQAKVDYLPIGNGKYQLMSIDEVTGTTKPVIQNGKPVIATHQQLLEAGGKKTESVTNYYQAGFEKEFGKGEGKRLTDLRVKADDAQYSLNVIAEAETMLDSGVYTGSAAKIRLGFDKWLQEAGVNIGGKTAANTEAYAGIMGLQVGKIIKAFGSGTGLSDADREYAQKIVAGEITLTEKSMRKLLDINKRIARFEIKQFNKQIKSARSKKETGDYYDEIEVPGEEQQTGGSKFKIIKVE